MPNNAPARRPNIILINCDDLGYGDLACYGSPVNKTPWLDQMAREGVRFTDFYMASPVCSPSRGGMLTGCCPPRIGFGSFEGKCVLMPGHPVGLNPQEVTFAKVLQQSGYATGLVGKWHCGDQPDFLPTRHGFDSFYGLPYSNDMGRQGPGDTHPPLPLMLDEEVLQEQPDQKSLTERYVEQCLRFLRQNAARPFFLYLAHMHVHLPIYAPDRFLQESANGAYGAAVTCIDWAAGVLLRELQRLGLDQNTLMIFTSDNGSRCRGEGGSNGCLRGTKRTTWEGGQRVPCIMRWPGRIPANTVCQELATAMDFYPTLIRLAGAEPPDDRLLDGKDILPLALGGGLAKSPHEAFFYYFMNNLEAVRDHEWKLHVRKGDQEIRELYHLSQDPAETRNVYERFPEQVERLSRLLEACRQDLGDEASGIPGRNIRPAGRVDHPNTLTHYDDSHPYMVALYDLREKG